jgi:nucleotide-binding universal stress UspA family protein
MSKPFTVVVGTDFSPGSESAVRMAVTLCERTSGRLILVHVSNLLHLLGEDGGAPALEIFARERGRSLEAKLDAIASAAREAGVDASARVLEGPASRVLPDTAEASRADLLVVGRRGSAGLSHVLLGSVTERVVRLAQCPVLVVPKDSAGDLPGRMLIGVDFSHASERAFVAAQSLAPLVGASKGLVLAHARPSRTHDLYLQNWSELAYERAYPFDREAMERWARRYGQDGIRTHCVMLDGRTEQGLIDTARETGCDWLVVGLQGRTALASLIMGSTTDQVLKLADRPVLVVPTTSAAPSEGTS